MYNNKTVIVDIDGTVANGEHRQHHVRKEPGKKKNWKAFNELMHLDTKHDDIIWLVKTLYASGCRVVFCSGRNEDDREVTIKWLKEAGLEGIYEGLYMRPAKDYRDDSIIKWELLQQIREDGHDPFLVLDDRDRVVNMWRKEGLRCLQVNPGDF
jgi:hypothetical protein